MAYVTGTASSLADLITAIQSACTANGWTLSGSVLHAGDCHIQLTAGTYSIKVDAGTGIDGSNALTGNAPASVYLGSPLHDEPLTFPCTYNIHLSSTEVYVLVHFGIGSWCWGAWGQSPVAGLPGTGVWFTASTTYDAGFQSFIFSGTVPYSGYSSSYNNKQGTGPFWNTSTDTNNNAFVHHALDGGAWTSARETVAGQLPGETAKAMGGAGYLMAAFQPNQWNGEAVLVPVQPYISRGSSKASIIADLSDARYVRLDNLNVEDTITLGTDVWKVYPFYRRDASNRNGSGTATGTLGWAIRYVP